jgi:hypothetical protein
VSRHVLAALACTFTLLSAPAFAQAAPRWLGTLLIEKVSSDACDSVAVAGDALVSVFRPQLDYEQESTSFTIVSRRSAMLLSLYNPGFADAPQEPSAYSLTSITGSAQLIQTSGSLDLTFAPSIEAIKPTTKFITMKGTIDGFGGAEGCTVTVRAAYSLAP